MSQKIHPIGDRILVVPVEEDKNSKIIRNAKDDKKIPQKGSVVALGSDYDGPVKKGDTVYWEKYEVNEYLIGKQTYFVGRPDSFDLTEKK